MWDEGPKEHVSTRSGNTPHIEAVLKEIQLRALIDTGSDITCIADSVWQTLSDKMPDLPVLPVRGMSVTGAIGTKRQNITLQTFATTRLGNTEYNISVFTIPTLSCDMIIGADWLSLMNAKINFETRVVQIEDNIIQFSDQESSDNMINHTSVKICESVNDTTVSDSPDVAKPKCSVRDKCQNSNVTEGQRQILHSFLRRHAEHFSDTPGCASDYTHRIILHDAEPFAQRSYPIPIAKRKAVDRQIQKMLEMGIIEPGPSAYVNPLITVVKKDGSVRVCLDARKLNSRTVPQTDAPQPMEELLQTFHEVKYFSTLRVHSGN